MIVFCIAVFLSVCDVSVHWRPVVLRVGSLRPRGPKPDHSCDVGLPGCIIRAQVVFDTPDNQNFEEGHIITTSLKILFAIRRTLCDLQLLN